MISLSSIVKARSLYEMPNGAGKYKNDNCIIKTKVESDKNQEAVLRQAIKKSQFIIDDAMKRADNLIENAKESADAINAEARRAGYIKGYEDGFDEGWKAAEKSAEAGLNEIAELIEAIQNERDEAIERQEKDLIAVAFEIAKKIMRQQIIIDGSAIPAMLADIVRENETGIKIHLSEYSKTLNIRINRMMAEKITAISQNARVIVSKEDDTIMAETENGMVDMSFPVQLKLLKKEIDPD